MGARRKVLLIEDDEIMIDLLASILRKRDYFVVKALNMEAGLNAVQMTELDFVITDIFMPGMGGIEGIQALKNAKPGLPVIAISGGWSGMDGESAVRAARKIGADSGLAKPFTAEDVDDLLARMNL